MSAVYQIDRQTEPQRYRLKAIAMQPMIFSLVAWTATRAPSLQSKRRAAAVGSVTCGAEGNSLFTFLYEVSCAPFPNSFEIGRASWRVRV